MNRRMVFACVQIIVLVIVFLLTACVRLDPQTSETTRPTSSAATTTMPNVSPTSANTTPSASTKESSATSASASMTTSPPLAWSTLDTEKSFAADDGTVLVTVFCSLPCVTNADENPAGIAINAYFDDLAADTLDEAAGVLAEAQNAHASQGSNFISWSYEMTGGVVWQSDRYSSAIMTLSSYSGGAHPDSRLISVCFDMETGQPTPLVHFFTIPENEVIDLLVTLIYEQTSTTYDESGTDLLYDCSEETIRAAFSLDHYYLTDDGLIIYFQPYDIAPYASGLPQFVIPCDAIADITHEICP